MHLQSVLFPAFLPLSCSRPSGPWPSPLALGALTLYWIMSFYFLAKCVHTITCSKSTSFSVTFPASLLLSHKWASRFSLLIMQDDFYHIQFSMRSHWRGAGAIFFSLIQPVDCVVNSIKSHYLSPARRGSCELSSERPLLFSAQAQGAGAPHTAPCYLGSHTGPRDPLHQGLFLPLMRSCPAR